MRIWRLASWAFVAAALIAVAGAARAADFSEPKTSEYIIKDFTFHTGEVMPEMRVSYTTVGDPSGEPVLMLHGTTGNAKSMLSDGFAGALYGPGQTLDATKYFIIIPDAIGTGGSSKPSDGLRAAFPEYNYDDMVAAQYDLVKNDLGIDHLRLVMGNSMGGMLTWVWGVTHPDFMDALVPMASVPGPMSGRNWMMRRMLIDAVRTDPAWDGGNYKEQPPNLAIANVWFSIGTSNGEKRLAKIGNTREAADAYVDKRLAEAKAPDANDAMYQWNASRDFDPTADLGKIKAALLVINSEDDERNPPELVTLANGMAAIGHGEVYIIPATEETQGHGTTGSQASLYADRLAEFLAGAPKM
ncbi:MAG TPA: alpha/beta fold hydrolase [Geminicoccaceae bacterium]|nr:alpha/beta fold hydrolase [Geminicoccaceae bacterium]